MTWAGSSWNSLSTPCCENLSGTLTTLKDFTITGEIHALSLANFFANVWTDMNLCGQFSNLLS